MVAKEYSKALYELAEELKLIDLINEQFNNVISLLKDKELMDFFLLENQFSTETKTQFNV